MLRRIAIVVAAAGVFGAGGLFQAPAYGESVSGATGHHEHGNKAAIGQDSASEKAKGNATVAEVCVVSGEEIDEKTKISHEYKGKSYSFCCSECLEDFKKDPEKYIDKMKAEKAEKSTHDHSTHGDHHHRH